MHNLCNLEEMGGRWWCKECDPNKSHLLKGNYKRQCKTTSKSKPIYIDAHDWFTTRHNQVSPQNDVLDLPSLLIKLERCRGANCDNLINDVCQTRGASCKAREFWFTKLMLGDCESWGPPDDRIRVGFLTPGLMMGGAERWIVDLASNLDKDIFNVVGIGTIQNNKVNVPLLEKARQATHVYLGKEESSKLLNIVDVLIYWGVDLINQVGKTNALRVYVSHGLPGRKPGKWQHPPQPVHKTAVSTWAAQIYPSASSVTIIHNGVDTKRLQPTKSRQEIREKWGLAPDDIAIGHIGRRSAEKAPFAAALAAATFGPPYRAVYVGNGPSDVNRSLRLFPNEVVVRSATEDVGNVYIGLDCFMMASRTEGFSLGMIEAWICGLPVIATGVGAVPELEEKFGPLVVRVPIEATGQQLIEAVQYAMSEENKPVLEYARSIAEEHFTVMAMANRWSDYLQGLMSDL